MALNKVEICGVNTSRLPILTNEEKDALFVRIKEITTPFVSAVPFGMLPIKPFMQKKIM